MSRAEQGQAPGIPCPSAAPSVPLRTPDFELFLFLPYRRRSRGTVSPPLMATLPSALSFVPGTALVYLFIARPPHLSQGRQGGEGPGKGFYSLQRHLPACALTRTGEREKVPGDARGSLKQG